MKSKSSKVIKSFPKAINSLPKNKTFQVGEAKEKYTAAYRPWTKDLDDELLNLYFSGKKLNFIAEHFGRTKGAILARLAKLEVEDFND